MSPKKVIFTYKRKRLSSCSSFGHADICHEFPADVRIDKHQGGTKGISESPKKDVKSLECINCDNVDHTVNCPSCLQHCNSQCSKSSSKHICHGEELSSVCSSPRVHKSSILDENNVEDSRSNTRKMPLGLYELSKDHTFKTSSENVFAGPSLGLNKSSSEGDMYCCSTPVDGGFEGASASQLVQNSTGSPSQSPLRNFGIVKSKVSAPLLTFRRRLKRKADASSAVMFCERSVGEGSAPIKESESTCLPHCPCEETSHKTRRVEESVDLKAINNDSDTRNWLCQSKDKMVSEETGYFRHPCTRSCSDVLILDHAKEKSCTKEDLTVHSSPVATLGSVASPSDVAETKNFSKENVGCFPNDGTVVLLCDGTNNNYDHHVSHQLQASTGDSQLMLNDVSDSEVVAVKMAEEKTTSGAFVIDCNVIPESDQQEQAPEIACHSSIMVKNHDDSVQDQHLKSKPLDLFGDSGAQAETSHVELPKDVCKSVEVEPKPNIKYLQLFSEDGKCDLSSSASTKHEIPCHKTEKISTYPLGSGEVPLEQSSSRAAALLGLSLATEPVLGQTSMSGSTMQPFQDHDARAREPIHNPASSFPDHASLILRHRMLLENLSNRASTLRGNRDMFLDRFESYPVTWTEEELDSLWIGIRRHGRGNWHAMLLDPRLHFAPWRVARDLAVQWELEQYKLLSGKPLSQDRYLKQLDPYSLDCDGGFRCPGIQRENNLAETQLSLGDVYTHKEGSFYTRGTRNSGIKQRRKRVRTSCKVGNSSCGLFNNMLLNNATTGGEVSPNGLAMGLATNIHLPHWLREPIGHSRSVEQPLPPISSLSQMGSLRLFHPLQETSGVTCGPRNLFNNRVSGLMAGEVNSPSGFSCAGPSARKQGMTDDPIVINSDASSEETISDDHNVRC